MKIVAVTACPTGIAHTYMAAEMLEKTAKAMGHEVRVETQGSMGIENELSAKDIKEADVVIFAVDIQVEKEERFAGKKTVKVGVGEAIKNALGVNRFIALDPATVGDGFEDARFRDNANWSWAFYGSLAGSLITSRTAHESFVLQWPQLLPGCCPNLTHNQTVFVYAELVRSAGFGGAGCAQYHRYTHAVQSARVDCAARSQAGRAASGVCDAVQGALAASTGGVTSSHA